MSKRNKWKKFRPNSNEELEAALQYEKTLTARWYERISGKVPWEDGAREFLNVAMDAQTVIVNRLIQSNAAEQFASLPNE